MLMEYHKQPNANIQKQIKEQLTKHLINTYASNNQTLNGRIYSIEELATYLQVPQNRVMGQVVEHSMQMARVLGEDGSMKEMYEGLLLTALGWALGDRVKVTKQLELLNRSQNGKYKPFISGEVNGLLGTLLKSQGALLEVAKTMKPETQRHPHLPGHSQVINGNVLYNNGVNDGSVSSVPGSKALTVDEASKLINERVQAPIALNPFNDYLEGTPNISALGEVSSISLEPAVHSHDTQDDPGTHASHRARARGYDDEVPMT